MKTRASRPRRGNAVLRQLRLVIQPHERSLEDVVVLATLLLCAILTAVLSVTLPAAATAEEVSAEELLFMEIPVVYAAAKFEQASSEAAAAVTVITAEEIERSGYRTIDDALRTVTGFYTVSDRTYTCLGVRGYYLPGDWNSRILVLVNGTPRNDDVYGTAGLGTLFGIDMDEVERVEIVKGPGSALFGTNALFAVINVVTKNPEISQGLTASAEYGSFESRKAIVGYGHARGELSFAVSGSYSDAEGQDLYFQEYDGYVDEGGLTYDGVFRNGDWDRALKIHGVASYGQFSLQAGFNSRDKGIPTAAYFTVFDTDETKCLDESAFLELKHRMAIDDTHSLLTRVYVNNYHYHADWLMWYEGEDDYYQELGVDFAKSRRVGTEMQFDYTIPDKNRLTVGAELQYQNVRQRYWDVGLLGPDYYYEYLNDERNLNVWSLYAQDMLAFRKTSIVLGVRHDHYSTFGSTTNPRLGLIYRPLPKTNVKLLYGSAFRAPTPAELYYSDDYCLLPNYDLEPERLRTAELVLEQELTHNSQIAVSAYNTELRNIIYQAVTDELGIGGDPMLQYQNIGKAHVSGLELTVRGVLAGVHSSLGYAYQRAYEDDLGDDKELVNSPRNLANLSLSAPAFSHRSHFTTELQYVGERVTVVGERLGDYLKTNAVFHAREVVPRVDVTARINNLFDIQYEDACSTEFLQTKLPQDGRSFVLKLTYRL